LKNFEPYDPISPRQVEDIDRFFKEELSDFQKIYKHHQPRILIGASGSFDTFAQLLVAEMPLLIQPEEENRSILRIGFGDFLNLHAKLLASTVDERNKMKGMEPMRAEMITLASIFVKSVLDITKITSIIQTDYALKEGVIAELLSLG